jgi:hypothetical protein
VVELAIQPEILRPYLGIARRFGAAGVEFAIENHDRFQARLLRLVVERAARDSTGICLDTANSLACGETVDQVLDVLAGRRLEPRGARMSAILEQWTPPEAAAEASVAKRTAP